MKPTLLEMYSAYLLAQMRTQADLRPPPSAVTISRETGAGAVTIAELVAQYLRAHGSSPDFPWAVFERNLVKKVLEEHNLPKRFESFMPEDSSNPVSDAIEDILGLHPPSSTLVRHTAETIFRLARRGNVIVVGRGSHLVTAQLRHVFHVRLVAPLKQRITHTEHYYHISHSAATTLVSRSDQERRRYLGQNFDSQIDDPLSYHLTVNMGLFSFEEAAKLIGDAVLDSSCKTPDVKEREYAAATIES